MTNLDSILKSRDITNKGLSSQGYSFSCSHVWMWDLDQKKVEYQRTDAFKLWCWRRLLRVPWTARRSNHSSLKAISLEYSLEGLMLKLKLQYFGHLMWRIDSLEKPLKLGKTEGRRRSGQHRVRWLDGITNFSGHEFKQALGVGDGKGNLVYCHPWDRRVWHDWTTELLYLLCCFFFLILTFCLCFSLDIFSHL